MDDVKRFEIFVARESRREQALKEYLGSIRGISVKRECMDAKRAEEAYAKVKGTGSIHEEYLKMAAEIAVEIAANACYRAASMNDLISKIYENKMKYIEKMYNRDLDPIIAKLSKK